MVGRPAPTSTFSFSGRSAAVTATSVTATPLSARKRSRTSRTAGLSSSARDALNVSTGRSDSSGRPQAAPSMAIAHAVSG